MREVYQTGRQLDVDLIIGLLEENGIKAVVKYSGAGDYMKILGAVRDTDSHIFVGDGDYDKARELIENNFSKEQTISKRSSSKEQRIIAWIVIAVWVVFLAGIWLSEILG